MFEELDDDCRVCEGSGKVLNRNGSMRSCPHCMSTGMEPPWENTGNQTALNVLIAEQCYMRALQERREQRMPPEYAI